MKRIILSDFATEQLRGRAAERERQYASAVEEYEIKLRARQDRIDSLVEQSRQAWREEKYLHAATFACAILLARLARRRERRRTPLMPVASETDQVWRYGREGEEHVHDYLSRQLDDSYTLLTGYRNPGGEIDAILVGREGVYAFEVKNHKGKVECIGDEWTRSKYDNYGNLVVCGEPITDRGGRSPSRQLNEPADRLQEFLARSLTGCRIYRAVVLANEWVTLGIVKNPTVDAIIPLHGWDLRAMFGETMHRLTTGDVERVVRQIARDHAYWEGRRASRNARGGSNAGPGTQLAPAA